MLYQIISSITIVTNGNTSRIIGKPNTLLLIHIDIIDIVSVHSIITAIVSCYIRFTLARIYIQLIYSFSTRSYQQLISIQSNQSAALASLSPLLGECAIDDVGCLPEDPAQWGAIADVMVTAYADPAQLRAEAYAAGCPVPALAAVCSQQATENALLATSYNAYIEAVRSGDADSVTAARDALATQRDASAAAIATATVAALGDTGTDAPTAIATAISHWALASDAGWLTADEGLLATLG